MVTVPADGPGRFAIILEAKRLTPFDKTKETLFKLPVLLPIFLTVTQNLWF